MGLGHPQVTLSGLGVGYDEEGLYLLPEVTSPGTGPGQDSEQKKEAWPLDKHKLQPAPFFWNADGNGAVDSGMNSSVK